jgi:hypothetical protein
VFDAYGAQTYAAVYDEYGDYVYEYTYVCELYYNDFYDESYGCDVWDEDNDWCQCYTANFDDAGAYVDCYSGDYGVYEAIYCHSGEVDEYGNCLDDCYSWYTTNDNTGVCFCEANYFTAAYTDGDGVYYEAYCDFENMFDYCGDSGIMRQIEADPFYECYCPEAYLAEDNVTCTFESGLDCYYDEYWGEYVCYEDGYCEADWELYYSSDETYACLDDGEYGINYDSCVFQ